MLVVNIDKRLRAQLLSGELFYGALLSGELLLLQEFIPNGKILLTLSTRKEQRRSRTATAGCSSRARENHWNQTQPPCVQPENEAK